jgi:hypothetical protein
MFGQGLNFGGLTGASGPFDADFLVVAGGGGSGSNFAGGSGAGGLRTSYGAETGGSVTPAETALFLSKATAYTVTVGAGGTGAPNGTNQIGDNGDVSSISGSDITDITTVGGGRGDFGGSGSQGGSTGGSGGGRAAANGSGYAGTAGQGKAGGNTATGTNGGTAGGGGSTDVGGNSVGGGASGPGGAGLAVAITGTSLSYAGGGGGGTYNNTSTSNIGGLGGGGNGGVHTIASGVITQATSGVINTGGGGGGGAAGGGLGGNGGAGIVILRYPTASVASYQLDASSGLDTTADTAYPIANTAYYKLNGNANDSSGNGYNGTTSNVTYAAGRFGQATVFNGTNSVVTLPGNTSISQENNFSLSLWVKPNGFPNAYNTLIRFYSNFRNYADIRPGGILGFNNSNNQIDTPSGTIQDGVWQHVVMTKSSTTGTAIYVNGVSVVTDSSDTGPASNFGAYNYTNDLGAYDSNQAGSPNLSSLYNGSIDQFRIFSSGLSTANVISLYNEATIIESANGTDSILQFIGGSGDITFS